MLMKTTRVRAASVLFLLIVLGAYLGNGRVPGAADTLPAAYLPWSLLRHGTFDLAEFRSLYVGAASQTFPLLDGIPFYLQYRNGHYLAAYGPGPGVLAVPIYAPFVLAGVQPDPIWVDRLEKLAAAIITALSAIILFWAVGTMTSAGWAFCIGLVYALGTSSLSISSQGLWQHGPSQLFLVLTLYFLLQGSNDDRYLGYVGFPMAAAFVMRSTDLLLVLPPAVWIVYAHRRRCRDLVLWALVPAAALVAYYATYYLRFPDHGPGHTTVPAWALFAQTPLSEGLPGVLFSPSRGLFVYSPVLLFSLIGMLAVWRGGPALSRALTVGPPLVVLLFAKWMTWWGGHSWGPRLLADINPILCFFLCPIVPLLDRHRLLKAVFVLLSLWSIGAHALGAWLYDRRWDIRVQIEGLRDAVPGPRHARIWSWDESPLAFYGREALFRVNRLFRMRGHARDTVSGEAGSFAAAYEVGPVPMEIRSGELFVLALVARNIGTEAWRVGLPGERGAVALVWHWYLGSQDVSVGSEGLLADVPPGGAATFDARVVAPATPGGYTLVLDLVSHRVISFADRGQAPVRFAVKVLPRDIAHTLSAPIVASGPVPLVTIATDRPSYTSGETLGLTVVSKFARPPRNFDVYLILERPDGVALFFDGHTRPRPADTAWPAWIRNLPLPAWASGRFILPIETLASGIYKWHAVVTEPISASAVARATAVFKIEPDHRTRGQH